MSCRCRQINRKTRGERPHNLRERLLYSGISQRTRYHQLWLPWYPWAYKLYKLFMWPPNGLQTASSGFVFQTGSLYYIGIHVHIAFYSYIGGLRGHCSLQMASEVTAGLRFKLLYLNNLYWNVFLASKCLYWFVGLRLNINIKMNYNS